MDFPAAPTVAITAPGGLAGALGGMPQATFRTGALRDLVAVFADEAAVRALTPDQAALLRLTREHDVRGFTVTAPRADLDAGYDFVSRFFAPGDGIPEDHVTGSAHTALAPYWAARLGRNGMVGLQASARSGLVRVRVPSTTGCT